MSSSNIRTHTLNVPLSFLVLLCACFVPPAAQAQSGEMYIYPAKGQSQQQQDKDRYECHTWAVQQTGFDPTKSYPSDPNYYDPKPASGRPVLRGAGRGAAMGAVGGAIAGDAGKGAAAGAAIGGMAGGFRRRDERRQQAAAQQQAAQAQSSSQVAGYQRAMAACLQGRGYNVN